MPVRESGSESVLKCCPSGRRGGSRGVAEGQAIFLGWAPRRQRFGGFDGDVIDSLDADRERDARWNALAAKRDLAAEADPSLLAPGSEALARIRACLG